MTISKRVPERALAPYERLRGRKELSHCDIYLETIADNNPYLQYDPVRTFVVYKGFSINILGKTQDGVFSYQASAYADNAPWNPMHFASEHQLDDLIEIVVERFSTVPKGER